jgi:hypothetical protein
MSTRTRVGWIVGWAAFAVALAAHAQPAFQVQVLVDADPDNTVVATTTITNIGEMAGYLENCNPAGLYAEGSELPVQQRDCETTYLAHRIRPGESWTGRLEVPISGRYQVRAELHVDCPAALGYEGTGPVGYGPLSNCRRRMGLESDWLDVPVPEHPRATVPLPPADVAVDASCEGPVDVHIGPRATSRELHVIGLYQGSSAGADGGERPYGEVTVRVERSSPMVLVLAAYEPVHWRLDLAEGTAVSGLLVNGYHPQRVSGAETIPVVEIRSGDGRLFESVDRYQPGTTTPVESYTGLALTSFHGCYEASQLTLR